MDRDYLREQIVLLLMGEETEISEEEIRRQISMDPGLQKDYEETLATLEVAAKRTSRPVSEQRWDKFMLDLNEKLERKKQSGILVGFAGFFRSPVRVTAAASVAAALVVGIALFLHFQDGDIDETITPPPIVLEKYLSLEEVDALYALDDSMLPSDDELYLIEDIYAGFAEQMESEGILEDLPDFQKYQLEDLLLLNKSNSQEGLS